MTWKPVGQDNAALVIENVTCPVWHEFKGLSLNYRVLRHEGAFQTGTTVTIQGRDITEFQIVLYLATEDDWTIWNDKLWPILKAKGSKPPSYRVQHPLLQMYGVNYIKFEKIGAPEPYKGSVWSVTLPCLEVSAPPKKEGGKVKATGGSGGSTADPNADLKAEQERNIQTINDLQAHH
jgi:hypothetical protein